MKKTLILFLLTIGIAGVFVAFDIQASTTYDGVVSLKEDGSWEWVIQPAEFEGFNDSDAQPLPDSDPETIPFNFNKFASFPIDYIGSWTWISGEVLDFSEDDQGFVIRLKTPKETTGWIQEYGDVFIIQYTGRTLNKGDLIEILVQYQKLGYKYYTNVPVFLYKDASRIK